ncbi:MAG: NUDIX domain-containing protein [Anaerolineae bacterium]|nr:NUDIX domain-containing protein [Anaerolineae bacterium]
MGRSEQGVQASAGRYTVIPRVLVFVRNGGDVLLLKGAPDKRIWADRYNGVGGHVEPDEDVYAAAWRETYEETGLAVRDLRFEGLINIDAGATTGIMLAVFSARSDSRDTVPSAEGKLEWVPLSRLEDYALVEDIPVLLARIAARTEDAAPFFARYWYDNDDRLRIAFAGDR